MQPQLRLVHQRISSLAAAGIPLGRRPELVGGELIRSLRGWSEVKAGGRGEPRLKGDERILGDSEFVLAVLEAAEEHVRRQERWRRQGRDLAWRGSAGTCRRGR